MGIRFVLDGFLQINDAKDAIHCRHCLLEIAINTRKPFDGIGKVDRIGEKCHKRARRDVPIDDLIAAKPNNEGNRNRREKFDRRCQHTRLLNVLHHRFKITLIAAHKGADYLILVGHQPWLGQLCSYLLNGGWLAGQYWSVKKSGIWWFGVKSGEGGRLCAKLKAAMTPQLLLPED